MKKDINKFFKFFKKINLSNEPLRRTLASLAYLPILIIIPAALMRKNTYIDFHVKQGLVLLSLEALTVISFYVSALPALFIIAVIALMVIGIVNASLGRRTQLPLFGKLAI